MLQVLKCFNTASGKYCCNIIHKKWQSCCRRVSIPQAVSTVATQPLFDLLKPRKVDCFNTASGKYCCNLAPMCVDACNAVFSFNTASGKYCCNFHLSHLNWSSCRFNTASGKYCCNVKELDAYQLELMGVSIPQAVSTVAT